MSAQLRAAGALAPLARRVTVRAVRHFHLPLPTGGIQRADGVARALRRPARFPANGYHNAVIVRNASFARMLPKLVIKFARLPALFGGLMVGGVAWIQYQAIRRTPTPCCCCTIADLTRGEQLGSGDVWEHEGHRWHRRLRIVGQRG
jgi:hypothetical protein